ncbi:uncharacterized protein B0I36DRAFT_345094 [Microdochium trichocladiopsis]|uniref:Uncharacterized protein n=1 Tax=Microdochium trichocladiopsis TaxID=1682393 RepID=A0A9P8YK45_9PEZI|nr:uncharacterized protein B0I36DRAFT_345094 [Microdochium trichocladiopsis]KAH7041498.1 hypothetical protein B0I36DRAFT_345094 [Microdochium trichocladiopsis]
MEDSRSELSVILGPEVLDELFGLRFPPTANDPDQVLAQATLWSQPGLPPDLDSKLRQLTVPILRALSQNYGPDPDTLLSLLIDPMLPATTKSRAPAPEASSRYPVLPSDLLDRAYIPRAVALVMLLDQCPRMYASSGPGTDARWVAHFFDPVAQALVYDVLLSQDWFLNYDGDDDDSGDDKGRGHWANAGYTFQEYLYITALVLTAADHSEDMTRHDALQAILAQRRAAIQHCTGTESPPFFRPPYDDVADETHAFSAWFRRGLPRFATVEEFALLRCATSGLTMPDIGPHCGWGLFLA